MSKAVVSFGQFLSKFPKIELPVILNEETHFTFSENNDPLTVPMIERFLQPLEEHEIDELTEFIPCFQLPKTEGFHAIVYWKAALLNYQYILATFTPEGEPIDRRVIAGTFVGNETITLSVATINEENEIFVASGQSNIQSKAYDATASTAYELELLPDGLIVNN